MRTMPQDAYTLRHIAAALNTALAGGRVNRIDQHGKDEVSLIVYTGRSLRLVLSANASECGAYFDDARQENPLVAPNFCMLLRKYLQGARIDGVSLAGFERILLFRLTGSTEFSETELTLALEVMGKYSNLILIEKGKVLGALKTTSLDGAARRAIFPGVKYVLPAPQDKADPTSLPALSSALEHAGGDLGHFLFTRVAGLAPRTAEHIASTFHGGDIVTHVRNFIFSEQISPCVVLENGVAVDFCAYLEEGGVPCDLLEAETRYYTEKRAKSRFGAKKRALVAAASAAVKKKEKRLAEIVEKRESCKDASSLRLKGELITANIYALSKGMTKCELVNYYDENGKTLSISLDARLSPAENAQSYFKRYAKAKRTLAALAPQEIATRAELDYLSSLLSLASCAETEEDLLSLTEEFELAELLKVQGGKKKNRPEIPFRTFEKEGFAIYAGRNNLQNDRLVRAASPDDLWLHAQKYHSCHVVIRCGGQPVPAAVKQFAADVCARYSDAGGDRIPVDCCRVKFVKKPPKAKAGFVTYSQFETLLGDPAAVK